MLSSSLHLCSLYPIQIIELMLTIGKKSATFISHPLKMNYIQDHTETTTAKLICIFFQFFLNDLNESQALLKIGL